MSDSALEEMLRSWGRAKAKINGTQPPPKSIAGKIATEGYGASIKGKAPEPLEVMLNTALEVATAIRTALDDHKLPYRCYEALFIKYACRGPDKAKVHQLGIGRSAYYNRLNVGRAIIADYLGMR